MIKLIKCVLITAIFANGLFGCVSTKETANLQNAQIERENEQKQLQEKQIEINEKVEQLAIGVEQWQEVQPGVTRLVAIEKELNLLISQLNAIVKESENNNVKAVKPGKIVTSDKQKNTVFYALQLISVGNAQKVEKAWADIYNKNSTLLSALSPLVESVVINNKTYYRIKVGKFSSKSEAKKVCLQLKAKSVNCLVTPYAGKSLRQFKVKNGA